MKPISFSSDFNTFYSSCSLKTCSTSKDQSMLFRSLRNDETNMKRRIVCLLRRLIYFYVHIWKPLTWIWRAWKSVN